MTFNAQSATNKLLFSLFHEPKMGYEECEALILREFKESHAAGVADLDRSDGVTQGTDC